MSRLDSIRKDVVNLNLSLKSITQEIQDCPGPMDELDDLNSKGRQKIIDLKKSLDNFENAAAEEVRMDVKQALLLEHSSLKDELCFTINAFKKATVACLMHIQTTARAELLHSDSENQSRHRKKKDKEDLVNMSSNVTDRLLSISRTLAETTQRSSDTLGTLVTSSGIVDGTREELDAQGNVISQSGKLLAKYGRREQTDKFLILFATAFFFACVFYVLQKRLF